MLNSTKYKHAWVKVWAITRTTEGSRIINKQARRSGKWSCRIEEQDLINCIGILNGDNPSQSITTVIFGFSGSTKCNIPYSTWDTTDELVHVRTQWERKTKVCQIQSNPFGPLIIDTNSSWCSKKGRHSEITNSYLHSTRLASDILFFQIWTQYTNQFI